MTRHDPEADTDTSASSPISTVVALALAASLAWAGIAAGPTGAGGAPADYAESDVSVVGSDVNAVGSEANAVGSEANAVGSEANAVARAPNGSDAVRSNGTEAVALNVTAVRNCGDRCRKVTANLTNTDDRRLRNVTAETRVYAADSRIWDGDHRFGNLSENASAERTARIELSLGGALRVVRNDGWVRIETTVRWDGGNATFTERRRVLD